MPVQCRKVPTNVNFGMKDLFFFIVYVMMALPIPQLMHAIFGSLAWPMCWHGEFRLRASGTESMRINSMTSDHRWYLLMTPQSLLFLQLCEWMQIPGWLQVFVFATPCMILKRTLKREQQDWCT